MLTLDDVESWFQNVPVPAEAAADSARAQRPLLILVIRNHTKKKLGPGSGSSRFQTQFRLSKKQLTSGSARRHSSGWG
jgi:hypothetical protein